MHPSHSKSRMHLFSRYTVILTDNSNIFNLTTYPSILLFIVTDLRTNNIVRLVQLLTILEYIYICLNLNFFICD